MRTYPMQSLFVRCLFVIGLLSPVQITAELSEKELKRSVVHIYTYSGQRTMKGTGFIVRFDGSVSYIVTNSSLLGGKIAPEVSFPGSNRKIKADIVVSETTADFAILKVIGLNLPPLKFGKEPVVGEVVWSAVRKDGDNSIGLSNGNVDRIYAVGNVNMMSHDAGGGGVGSVLLNDCGEVVGLNTVSPSQDGKSRAISVVYLLRSLKKQNIRYSEVASTCEPLAATANLKADLASSEAKRARAAAERAEETTVKLEKKIRTADRRNLQLASQVRDATIRADQAITAAEKATQLVDETRQEWKVKAASIAAESEAYDERLDRIRAESEERLQLVLREQAEESSLRLKLMIGAFVVLGVMMIGLVFVMLRSFTSQVPGWLSAMNPAQIVRKIKTEFGLSGGGTPVEYVLDGHDEDGKRYNLRILAELMRAKEGVVIGRNPEISPYVINHADVSRKHLRLIAHKERIFIEDLGSTNGTMLNGDMIKGMVSISNGDQIELGGVVLNLEVKVV